MTTLHAQVVLVGSALDGVVVAYIVSETEARQRLSDMVRAGAPVAIDIETAPHNAEVEKLARLLKAKEIAVGKLRALKKLEAPAAEIAALVAEGKQLTAAIKYAKGAGLDPRRARIRLLQVYDGGDRVLVIDLDHTGAGVLDLLNGVSVIAHNAAFEMSFIEPAGVALGTVHCTQQACRLMLGERADSPADGAEAYLDLKLDKTEQKGDWNAPHLTRQQIEYAALDAVVAWRIAEKILPRFDVQRSAYEIQMRAVPAAMRMEHRGFRLDVEAHARLIADLKQERIAVEQQYREACTASGHPALADTVPSTAAQKEAVLTTLLSSDELARWRRTEKSGALSTKRSELLRAGHYPPIRAMVKLSRIDKMLSSFGQTLAARVSSNTGKLHANYKVAGTASGRASCAGPNLQQIPRTSKIADFRALFIPEPGHVLVVADYSSMELRAAAYISGDYAMTAAFEQGLDLHKITAARMTGKTPEEVTAEERRGAKTVNFGAAYGIGATALVQSAWDSYELVLDAYEAKRWLAAFAQSFPTFARWRSENYERCSAVRRIVIGRDAAQGVGRVFPFSRLTRDDNGYTHCCNLPVQGACADASMLALAYVDDRLFEAGIEGGPVAWLHDEIVLEVREDQAERAAEILKQSMIDGFTETFPGAPLNGLVEPHIGPNWGAAKAGEIRTGSGVTPEPDFALVYAERVKLRIRGVDEDDAKARALEHGVAACDGARPSEGVAMSHSASQTATGAFRAGETADIGRAHPEGFPEASGAGEAYARVAPTFYEFFAGGGMARAGLGPGWTCLLANDNDQRKGASYASNWTADQLVVGDVGALTTAAILGVAGLAWASPPCQDLSLAGDRAGLVGSRSSAFWSFWRLMQGRRAERHQPQLVVIENVCGLLTSHGGKDFDAICDALVNEGYRFGAVVIDAALFVPQSRERVFIIGVDADAHIPTELLSDGPMAPFHPTALVAACKRQRDPLWWRLPVPPKRNTTLADIIEDEPTGVRWHTQVETDRLIGMMTSVHLAKFETAKRAGRRMVGGLYRRIRVEADGTKVQRAEVRFDDVAGCLRVPTGGSSRQTIVIVEGASVKSRLLSPREAARLMGLPEDYQLPSNYNDAYGLMGDGVVVPVVRFLAEHILEPVLAAQGDQIQAAE